MGLLKLKPRKARASNCFFPMASVERLIMEVGLKRIMGSVPFGGWDRGMALCGGNIGLDGQ